PPSSKRSAKPEREGRSDAPSLRPRTTSQVGLSPAAPVSQTGAATILGHDVPSPGPCHPERSEGSMPMLDPGSLTPFGMTPRGFGGRAAARGGDDSAVRPHSVAIFRRV